jgi:hypothetical protein
MDPGIAMWARLVICSKPCEQCKHEQKKSEMDMIRKRQCDCNGFDQVGVRAMANWMWR